MQAYLDWLDRVHCEGTGATNSIFFHYNPDEIVLEKVGMYLPANSQHATK